MSHDTFNRKEQLKPSADNRIQNGSENIP